jgi:hypothetical protein
MSCRILLNEDQQYRDYLVQADECEMRAARAEKPDIKREYLELAHQWRHLAETFKRMGAT